MLWIWFVREEKDYGAGSKTLRRTNIVALCGMVSVMVSKPTEVFFTTVTPGLFDAVPVGVRGAHADGRSSARSRYDGRVREGGKRRPYIGGETAIGRTGSAASDSGLLALTRLGICKIRKTTRTSPTNHSAPRSARPSNGSSTKAASHPVQLFDLEKDLGETTDLAAEHPDLGVINNRQTPASPAARANRPRRPRLLSVRRFHALGAPRNLRAWDCKPWMANGSLFRCATGTFRTFPEDLPTTAENFRKLSESFRTGC